MISYGFILCGNCSSIGGFSSVNINAVRIINEPASIAHRRSGFIGYDECGKFEDCLFYVKDVNDLCGTY